MVLRRRALRKSARRLQREDYSIGWICPLVIERAAAEAMLDERHESLPNYEDDINVYTLGRIGRHNVAIAGLPDASSLAMLFAAQHMRFAFRNIRVVLLVGIGGGVPGGENDVRLGDIVVGGVIQVDAGLMVPEDVDEDGFVVSGTTKQPSAELCDIIDAVRRRHQALPVAESPAFVGYLAKAIEERPRMEAHYPGADQDRIFEHTYDHKPDGPTCRNCDSEKIIHREARQRTEPRVHHGLIASANNVRKDGGTREKLRKKLNILCFEMEATGILNDRSWLVIRGISDYADSHKNDQWQPYTALAAAAYAKEWLSMFPEIGFVAVDPVVHRMLLRSAMSGFVFSRSVGIGLHWYLFGLRSREFSITIFRMMTEPISSTTCEQDNNTCFSN